MLSRLEEPWRGGGVTLWGGGGAGVGSSPPLTCMPRTALRLAPEPPPPPERDTHPSAMGVNCEPAVAVLVVAVAFSSFETDKHGGGARFSDA